MPPFFMLHYELKFFATLIDLQLGSFMFFRIHDYCYFGMGHRWNCSCHNIQAMHFMGHSWLMEAQQSSSSNSSCGRLGWLIIDHAIPHQLNSQSGKMGDTMLRLSYPALSLLCLHHHLLLMYSGLGTCPAHSSSLRSHHPEERDNTTTITPTATMRVVRLNCSNCSAMPKICRKGKRGAAAVDDELFYSFQMHR